MNTTQKELKKSKCNKCGFIQEDYKWQNDARYEYNGKEVKDPIGGDHARCPQCNKLVHIDYDLTEV